MNELAVFLKNKACKPQEVMHALMNNKRMGGFHLVDIQLTNNGRLGLTRKKNKKITNTKDIAILGKGAEGVAFVGCVDDKCKKMIVIKAAEKGLKLEYRILMKIYKLSPHVATPYMFIKCDKQELMYQKYANGGDLLNVIREYGSVIQPNHMKTILFQVLFTLMKIQKKNPSFKHNDMHLKNVLLDLNFKHSGSTKYDLFYVPNIGLRAIINDYGFATLDSVPNPKVVSKEYAYDFGIAPDSHKMYDAHVFLNSLYIELANKPNFSNVIDFIKDLVPMHYLGIETRSILNSRMRYGMSHSDFPTFSRLLFHPYFKEFQKVRNNVTDVVNSPSPTKPKPVVKSPSPPKPKPTPVEKPNVVDDMCGDKARPTTGVGFQKLTSTQLSDLIKRRGHKVPKGQPSRKDLCAVIKEHDLKLTPEAANIKKFLASQNVIVVKPQAPTPVPFVSEKKLWELHIKKLTDEIYNTMPKDGEYQDRMDEARAKAVTIVRNMKARGEAAPAYYKK
jgi:hypothetical protein